MQNVLLFSVLFSVAIAASKRGRDEGCYYVSISADMILKIAALLSVLKQYNQVEVPCQYFSDLLQNVDPNVALKPFGDDGKFVTFNDQGTLVTFVHPDTGES